MKTWIDRIFLLAALLLLALSLAGYLGELSWYLDLASHFKVQYLLLSLIPAIFFLLKRHRLGLLVSLVCLALNLLEVVPWYLPSAGSAASQSTSQLTSQPTSQSTGQSMRVLLSNVDKHHAQYPRVIEMVQQENPDVAVLIEVGVAGVQQLEPLRQQFPYFMAHQDAEIDGTAIYSKLPLLNPTVRSLGGGRKAILVELAASGAAKNRPVSLIAVHPSNAVGRAYVEERNQQLRAIADYVAGLQQPVILIGDLNTTMWSPFYRKTLGKTRLHNTRSGFGILPTWKIIHPFFAIPIDHCLVTLDIQTVDLQTGRAVGSDHLPLVAELRLPA